MKKNIQRIFLLLFTSIFLFGFVGNNAKKVSSNPPIYIAFLWHMHQPIYWPYESVVQTQANNRYPFSVFDIFNQRIGPYTSWPAGAVEKGIAANLSHFGAQVSFSGSLMENLNNLEADGNQNFQNWKSSWTSIRPLKTSLGNPRLDMVGFGYFHPLMGLIDYLDIRKQIEMHKQAVAANFGGTYSKGIFPPENAFSERMIPALVDEGLQWVLVDNIHFERACVNYPYSTGGNIYEPNKADQLNPDPGDWTQLNGVWEGTKISAKWAHLPHYDEYIDPSTGKISKMIVVPADRYLGVEDGRGGFGALNYDAVMSQLESYNTDPNHPVLIVLAHDGDNYGGGSDSYYNSNFQNFVDWLQSNPSRFVCTTIQDYLQMFPPDSSDVIHVEDGSWSGADNGDPEFKKWLGDPDASGYSPDRNSWGVITAAKNFVFTANQIDSTNSNTQNAWKYLLVGESSDYWYWDNSLNGIWDAHPTEASNQAVQYAEQIKGTDLTPPTIFLPQRIPYDPGATMWGINQTNNVDVWSYVYDISGLKSVTLKYRTDNDGTLSDENYTYAGGGGVSAWTNETMTGAVKVSNTNPQPLFKAEEYSAAISGLNDKMIDYYIEAVDSNNNIARSPIRHCWIGANQTGQGGGSGVSWSPASPTQNDTILITIKGASQGAKLHWGINYSGSVWQKPDSVYWTPGSALFSDGIAVESPFAGPDTANTLQLKLGPFNNVKQKVQSLAFVIHYNDNTWDNNNNQNYDINFGGGSSGNTFVMDGAVDTSAQSVASNGSANLYLGWNGTDLYVATQSAQSAGKDVFIFVSDTLGAMTNAPWAKVGQVAGYSAYLANESTNNFVSWYNATGTTNKAAGNYLEGTINIQQQFGFIPAKLYISVGQYQTADGGALQGQIPSGNGDGNIDPGEFYSFNYTITSVNDARQNIPSQFSLSQNYPNPFNPSTVIEYSIPQREKVSLKIYDVLGKEVASLVDEDKSAGKYSVRFNAGSLSSGVYFYILRAGDFISAKKLILMK